MKPSLPNLQPGPLDGSGRFTSTWVRFFGALVSDPPAPVTQTLAGSPAVLAAPDDGHFYINGGTVTALGLTRGRFLIGFAPSDRIIPASKGDQVSITYSVAPSVVFIPS